MAWVSSLEVNYSAAEKRRHHGKSWTNGRQGRSLVQGNYSDPWSAAVRPFRGPVAAVSTFGTDLVDAELRSPIFGPGFFIRSRIGRLFFAVADGVKLIGVHTQIL